MPLERLVRTSNPPDTMSKMKESLTYDHQFKVWRDTEGNLYNHDAEPVYCIRGECTLAHIRKHGSGKNEKKVVEQLVLGGDTFEGLWEAVRDIDPGQLAKALNNLIESGIVSGTPLLKETIRVN